MNEIFPELFLPIPTQPKPYTAELLESTLIYWEKSFSSSFLLWCGFNVDGEKKK